MMTRAANEARRDRLRTQVVEQNPNLSEPEIQAAVRLLMRAEMARLSLKRWSKRS